MDLDFDINLNVDLTIGSDIVFDTKHYEPQIEPEIKEEFLDYKKAKDLASHVVIKKAFRFYSLINGSFIFGDFIEALIVSKNLIVKEMTVSTLSLNENNVDSFANIMNAGYCDKFNLIVSDYFHSHERHKLIPYIYSELEKNDRFQLSVYRTHCKIVLLELYTGEKIIIHGSANLRSSGNIEQIMIEENEGLYDFNYNYHKDIIEKYKTIKRES